MQPAEHQGAQPTRGPGPWEVHGPTGQRAGWAVGRAIYGSAPFFGRSTEWLLRADRGWRQWRSQEAAQRVADQLNEQSGPPAPSVATPPEHAGCEDAYHAGYFGLHHESPYDPGCNYDLAWRAGQRDATNSHAANFT